MFIGSSATDEQWFVCTSSDIIYDNGLALKNAEMQQTTTKQTNIVFKCSMSKSTNFFEWISLHESEQDKSHSVFCYLTQTPWLIRRLGYKPLEVFTLFHGNTIFIKRFQRYLQAINSPYKRNCHAICI